jgi:hypothetical protein
MRAALCADIESATLFAPPKPFHVTYYVWNAIFISFDRVAFAIIIIGSKKCGFFKGCFAKIICLNQE